MCEQQLTAQQGENELGETLFSFQMILKAYFILLQISFSNFSVYFCQFFFFELFLTRILKPLNYSDHFFGPQ